MLCGVHAISFDMTHANDIRIPSAVHEMHFHTRPNSARPPPSPPPLLCYTDAGALHDNHRALVMGDVDHTYGKGRIQSVYELQDGSALFVTVAKYRTPGGADIDKRGIHPDRSCRMPSTAAVPTARLLTVTAPSSDDGGNSSGSGGFQPLMTGLPMSRGGSPFQDPSAGGRFMPGVPLDRPTEALLLKSLTRDRYSGVSQGLCMCVVMCSNKQQFRTHSEADTAAMQ